MHFIDPLGAPVAPPDGGDALSTFGDALAAPGQAADALGLPPVELPGLTGLGPGPIPPPLTTPYGMAGAPARGPGGVPWPRPGAEEPFPPAEPPLEPSLGPAQPPPGSAEPAGGLAFTELSTTTLQTAALGTTALQGGGAPTAAGAGQPQAPGRQAGSAATSVLPAAPPPAAPRATRSGQGRISAGYPRGWDPPSVPASRGWSKRPARPQPERRRRPPGAVPPAPGSGDAPGAEQARPQPPPESAAPARFLRRTGSGRRPDARLPALAMFVLLATILAAQTHDPRLILGVVVLGFGLFFVGYGQRLSRLDRHRTNR